MNMNMLQPTLLSAREHELLSRCVCWHVRPHRRVLLDALAAISPSLRFEGLNVFEIGATARSAVSPFLVARGACARATCYEASELPKLQEAVALLSQQYGLAPEKLHVDQADVFALDETVRYDLVLLKDVLGGVNRQHDQAKFKKAVCSLLGVLRDGGHLLIVDKSPSLKIISWILRKWGAAGKRAWHYFTFEELEHLLPTGASIAAFTARGVLGFGDFGDGTIQRMADFLDEHCLERFVPPKKRVIFSLLVKKDDGSVNLKNRQKPETVAETP
jgi:hypothetical protein